MPLFSKRGEERNKDHEMESMLLHMLFDALHLCIFVGLRFFLLLLLFFFSASSSEFAISNKCMAFFFEEG